MATSGTQQSMSVRSRPNQESLNQASSNQNRSKSHASSEAVPIKVERSAKTMAAIVLRQGLPYQKARQLVLQQGWQVTQPTSTDEAPNLNNLAVKKLFDLGYKEIKDCSGTGLGLCRFAFTNQNGERFVVITAGGSGDPTVHNWFIEKHRDASQQSSFSVDDDRFRQQNFSQLLLKQVHQLNQACGFYDITSPCSSRKYIFRDAVLTTKRNGTESTTTTLIPIQPISTPQALSYSRMLDASQAINFTKAQLQQRKLVYGGCLHDAGKGTIPLCRAELTLTPNGRISSIVITRESP